ncbi:L-aspartate oxidase [Thalassobacillus devorans]|uniref:L-aspartate oxidase n=1 Tax=Thalassobacillus devorans TaxID=279813 RepID=UPI0015949C23|nr:FAD-binding protein [Thalassobacillus devorans]
MDEITTDILVIGSGAAGLAASVYAAESSQQILVIDKGAIGRSGSTVGAVQIASLGSWSHREDSLDAYQQDIRESGRGLSSPVLTDVLVQDISARLEDLLQWGLKLDKNEHNDILVAATSGHTTPRSISSKKGKTGLAILQVLTKRAKNSSNIKRWSDVITLELVKANGRVAGAVVLDLKENKSYLIRCKTVILATGGIGQLYPTTSNPAQSTGDGFALSLTAGAALVDMEQIQFYPVSLIHPSSLSGLCLSFYHSAKLYNRNGERFMDKYEPETMENTTRDKLAIAIASEVEEGLGTPGGGVWVDATGNIEEVKRQFHHEYQLCLDRGVDLARKQAEAGPAAHFIMGGIWIDGDAASTTPGLYAAGESAGGLHGGNRLGNNALSECIVFGARAGKAAARESARMKSIMAGVPLQTKKADKMINVISNSEQGTERSYACKKAVQALMGEYVGVVRSTKGLLQAKAEIKVIEEKLDQVKITSSLDFYSKEILDYIEAVLMVTTAQAIVEAALTRKESRGAHHNKNFPEQLTEAKHTIVKVENGKMTVQEEGEV